MLSSGLFCEYQAKAKAMSFAALKNVGKVSAPFTLDFSFYLFCQVKTNQNSNPGMLCQFSKPTDTWILPYDKVDAGDGG